MLIDIEVLDFEEVIEIFNDKEVFKQRIAEAVELLKEEDNEEA